MRSSVAQSFALLASARTKSGKAVSISILEHPSPRPSPLRRGEGSASAAHCNSVRRRVLPAQPLGNLPGRQPFQPTDYDFTLSPSEDLLRGEGRGEGWLGGAYIKRDAPLLRVSTPLFASARGSKLTLTICRKLFATSMFFETHGIPYKLPIT